MQVSPPWYDAARRQTSSSRIEAMKRWRLWWIYAWMMQLLKLCRCHGCKTARCRRAKSVWYCGLTKKILLWRRKREEGRRPRLEGPFSAWLSGSQAATRFQPWVFRWLVPWPRHAHSWHTTVSFFLNKSSLNLLFRLVYLFYFYSVSNNSLIL